jgi:hypothetical protein
MKLNWKNVKYMIDIINPYTGTSPNNEDYEKLWNSIRTLCVLNFEEGNKIFMKMVKYDRELYSISNKEV